MPALGWALVPYPVAGIEPEELEARAKAIYRDVVALLTKDRPFFQDRAGQEHPRETIRLEGASVSEVMEKLHRGFNQLRWSDGLPVLPPTRDAVDEMLNGIRLAPEMIIGRLYPNQGKATVEKIAVNAVMAGCTPDYMPILVAALQAILTPQYEHEVNLVSTGSFFPVAIVNGPLAATLNINAGRGLFGPGWRANATIGRAIRLMIINIGGCWPGVNDMGVMGHPGRYTCCIAENETSSPWLSLSEELGYPGGKNAVTVMPGHFMGYFDTAGGSKPEDFLQPLCNQLCSLNTCGSLQPAAETLVVLNPVHARMLDAMGFNKNAVKQYIFENTRFDAQSYSRMVELSSFEQVKTRKIFSSWPGATVPMHESADKIRIIVGGAEGSQGLFVRGFLGRMVTCEVIT